MSRLHSTSSIQLPEIFSDGRFEIGCETPYSPARWINEPTTGDFMLHVECMPGQVFVFHGDELYGPSFSTMQDRVEFALRQICHLLIERLDKSGLEEAFQSLAEFYEYYRPKDEHFAHTQARAVTSQGGTFHRVMPSVEGRPFRISED